MTTYSLAFLFSLAIHLESEDSPRFASDLIVCICDKYLPPCLGAFLVLNNKLFS